MRRFAGCRVVPLALGWRRLVLRVAGRRGCRSRIRREYTDAWVGGLSGVELDRVDVAGVAEAEASLGPEAIPCRIPPARRRCCPRVSVRQRSTQAADPALTPRLYQLPTHDSHVLGEGRFRAGGSDVGEVVLWDGVFCFSG